MKDQAIAGYQQGYADALSQARAFIDQKREVSRDPMVTLGLQKALNVIDGLIHALPAI